MVGRTCLIKTEMLLLLRAGAGQEVVENVEIALARGDGGDSAALETMVEQLSTNEGRVKTGGCVVLEFEKETGFGSGGSGDGLCGGQSVENKGGVGQLVGQWRRCVGQQSRKNVRTQGRLA